MILRQQAKWYEGSLKTQKIIIMVTLRSQRPCKLTAAKIIDLSMENFAMVRNNTKIKK